MDAKEKKEIIQKIKQEAWFAWVVFFIVNLIVTSHVVYENAAHYAGMGILQYGFVLAATAAIMATVVLVITGIMIILLGMIGLRIAMWWDSRKDARG